MNASNTQQCGSLCACRAAVALGVVWGLCILGLGIATIYTEEYGRKFVEVMGSIYPWYEAESWVGAWWGALWGFVDGFIGGFIIVGLYNMLCACGSCCCSKSDKSCCAAPEQPSSQGQQAG